MDALGIPRYFRADDALGVGVVGGAMHAPDAVPADHLDIERADRRAVVRTDGGAARDVEWGVHGNSKAQAWRSQAGRARGESAAANDGSRRIADVADHGLGRLDWAES